MLVCRRCQVGGGTAGVLQIMIDAELIIPPPLGAYPNCRQGFETSRFVNPKESIFSNLFKIFSRLSAWALVAGAVGGLAGLLFLLALRGLEAVLSPSHFTPGARFGVLAGVGLIGGILIARLGDPGGVDVLVDNIHLSGGDRNVRQLRSLLPVSLLCIAAGGAAGPEAPLVQMTGSLGSLLSRKNHFPVSETRILTITGMAAGFTVLFGAPLGAAIFALEILHRKGLEYYEALFPALLGSLCGYAVFTLMSGWGLSPLWRFPDPGVLHKSDLLWSALAGIAAAPVAAAFAGGIEILRSVFIRIPVVIRLVLGGLILAALGVWSPFALTFGELQVNLVSTLPATAGLFAIAALAKFFGTGVTISSGWKGGFIIPLFFIGVCLGRMVHVYIPAANEAALMAAFMAALNTAVTKTPIGSTLVVTEMAGLPLMPTTLLATLISLVLTDRVSLIHSQRNRDDSETTEHTSKLG